MTRIDVKFVTDWFCVECSGFNCQEVSMQGLSTKDDMLQMSQHVGLSTCYWCGKLDSNVRAEAMAEAAKVLFK